MIEWDKFVKKYIWDDDKTPYFISVGRLTRTQAQNEIFVYAFFLATVFALGTILLGSGVFPDGHDRIYLVTVYAFFGFLSAIFLGARKHLYAALYCMTAPVAAFLYLMVYGFHPNLHTVDKYVLLGFLLIWLAYGVRVVAITKAYNGLPEPAGDTGS